MAGTDESLGSKTQNFLIKLSKAAANISPVLSRSFMYRSLEMYEGKVPKEQQKAGMCGKCGTVWRAFDLKIRTQPRPVFRKGVRKLLSKEMLRPWTLTRRQRKELRFLKRSATKLVYLCKLCGKSQKYPCPRIVKPGAKINEDQDTHFFKGKGSNIAATPQSPTRRRSSLRRSQVFLQTQRNKKVVATPTETASVKRTKSLLKAMLNEQDARRQMGRGLQSFLSSL